MIRKITKAGNFGIRIITGVLAVIFILYGFLSVWDMFRTELKAYSSYDLLKYRPNVEENEAPSLDDLIEVNPDTTAWLTIYKTNIDYPVFQGKNDREYLNKNAYGEYTVSGSIYMSCLNKRDFSEPYQLIYGHHMENGSMFGDIDKFVDKDFFYNSGNRRFKEDEGVLIVGNEAYDLFVFAVVKTDAYDNMFYRPDKSESELQSFLTYVKDKAMYYRNVGEINHVIALSTCDSAFTDGRTILLCKVATEPRDLPSVETKKHTIKRTAVGHPMAGAYWAFFNLVILILTLYTAFPVHLIKKMKLSEEKKLMISGLITAAISLIIFIITQDMRKPIEIVDKFTPVMIVILIAVWVIQNKRQKKLEESAAAVEETVPAEEKTPPGGGIKETVPSVLRKISFRLKRK